MGWEKVFADNLRRLAVGAGRPLGFGWTGGTPNHWALAAANAYAWGITRGSADERLQGRAQALEVFARQRDFGHMARMWQTRSGLKGASELGTSSHFAWWQAAVYGIRWFAFRKKDTELLAATRQWLRGETALEKLCAVPGSFKVAMPGARTFVARGAADQRVMIYHGFQMVTQRRPLHRSPEFWNALDRTGLWFLRLLLEKGDDLGGATDATESDLPRLVDPLYVKRTKKGHVAWFDHFTGLCPAYYAWIDYETGEERWGADPSWPKSHPGGDNPFAVPEPPGSAALAFFPTLDGGVWWDTETGAVIDSVLA
jgi:hypothetical protein